MEEDKYMQEIFTKCCKIHVTLPKGHLLVFLSGRREIEELCHKLRERFKYPSLLEFPSDEQPQETVVTTPPSSSSSSTTTTTTTSATTSIAGHQVQSLERQTEDIYDETDKKPKAKATGKTVHDLILESDDDLIVTMTMTMTNDKNENENEKEKENNEKKKKAKDETEEESKQPKWYNRGYLKVRVLAVYSLMEPEKQAQIFEPVSNDTRLVVVATNIAETSITIPGIRYVLDSGRSKQKKFEPKTNMSRLAVDFISKASSAQRAGRAGRTGPGHAYRLYSAAFYDRNMPEHFEPEILRTPMDNIVLQMKAMSIERISTFPFPTPAPKEAVYNALKVLETLGALSYDDSQHGGTASTDAMTSKTMMVIRDSAQLQSDEASLKITALGKALLEYPIGVRCGKMLLLGHQGGCLPYVIGLVALLSIESLQYSPDEIDTILTKQIESLQQHNNSNNNNDHNSATAN
ncbi:hypothetical protein RFI_30921, partial [Reticulomyxa filosa]